MIKAQLNSSKSLRLWNLRPITGQYKNMDCGLLTTDCGLGIKHGLGIKGGLGTTLVKTELISILGKVK